MRLDYSTHGFSLDRIGDTTFFDGAGARAYATCSSACGRTISVVRFGGADGYTQTQRTVGVLERGVGPDVIRLHRRRHEARGYLVQPAVMSNQRMFTTERGRTYSWRPAGINTWSLLLDNAEVGRSYARTYGLHVRGGEQRRPRLELTGPADVLADLDEIVVTFVYLQSRGEKERARGTGTGVRAASGSASHSRSCSGSGVVYAQ